MTTIKLTRLPGKSGNLLGQNYTTDFDGTTWHIESRRTSGGGRAIWFASADDGRHCLGYGRKELEQKMRESTP